MYDVFNKVRLNLEKDNKIHTKTLFNLNPSSQVCYDSNQNQIGSCLRQVWLEKMDQPKTNKIGISAVMAGFSGNWWEDWFINQLKELGLYYNSSFAATDVNHFVKGIVDVAIKNTDTNEIELGEIKTYDGSNYYVAQNIIGNTKVAPKPKDKHLLQAFRYSLIFKDQFKANNLFYIDRACGAWKKHKQFRIELVEINKDLYPKISTVWNDNYYEYTDTRISANGVYSAEAKLLEAFSTGQIPDKEFIEIYSETEIEDRYSRKDIPDYAYTNYKKDPKNNSLGDVNCKYCPFSNGTCKNYE